MRFDATQHFNVAPMHLAPPGYHDAGVWPPELCGQLDVKVRCGSAGDPAGALQRRGAATEKPAAAARDLAQMDCLQSEACCLAATQRQWGNAAHASCRRTRSAALPLRSTSGATQGTARDPPQDKAWAFWERRTHAVVWRLLQQGLLSLDELRRAVEGLPPADASRSYYEKWVGRKQTIQILAQSLQLQAHRWRTLLPCRSHASGPRLARARSLSAAGAARSDRRSHAHCMRIASSQVGRGGG